MRLGLTVALLLMAGSAFAQQPDIPMLQKALAVVQGQRNQALDAQAGAEVRAATLAEEVTRLKARIADLEKVAPVAPAKPAE